MKIEQSLWTSESGWVIQPAGELTDSAQLVIIFGSKKCIANRTELETLRGFYPNAYFIGCSTAGEIFDLQVLDDSISAAAIKFDHTLIKGSRIKITEQVNSFAAGQALIDGLPTTDLKHVFVLSDGQLVNGTELAKGMTSRLPTKVAVTGGLSGDGANFKETFVLSNSEPESGIIAAIGFYGDRIRIGYGSMGGWDPFGPNRLITKSSGNVLYEMDGKPALQLYKEYLGDRANELPSAALLFPLNVRANENDPGVVRTILSVDETTQSMIFAGDVPQGSFAQLMKANFDRLIDGAQGAAEASLTDEQVKEPTLAILISCIGRKLVLGLRIEEEIEAVRDVLGNQCALTGFYSYGELSPFRNNLMCELHNQTMTITTIKEV